MQCLVLVADELGRKSACGHWSVERRILLPSARIAEMKEKMKTKTVVAFIATEIEKRPERL